MNILQIKWLSMISNTFDYSFWVNVGQTFLNLFIGSNRVIVCSESSIVRSLPFRSRLSDTFPVVRRRSVPARVC